jgi:hypothetical protein
VSIWSFQVRAWGIWRMACLVHCMISSVGGSPSGRSRLGIRSGRGQRVVCVYVICWSNLTLFFGHCLSSPASVALVSSMKPTWRKDCELAVRASDKLPDLIISSRGL